MYDNKVLQSKGIEGKSNIFAPPKPLDLYNVTTQKNEKSVAFPLLFIYEDKSENMRAISLKRTSFSTINNSKTYKVNN